MNIRFDPEQGMPDVQSATDHRRLAIQQVGVKGVRQPLLVRQADGSTLATVASFSLYVALPETRKGTHMSRFISLLEENRAALDTARFSAMLTEMLLRLEAERGRIEVRFPYFVNKRAPVSGVESLMDYDVALFGEATLAETRITLEVVVPVTSLCPCSKEVSEYGAHNQRSHVTVRAELRGEIAVEEVIAMVEAQASCELWGLLKRSDEKFVTERAYDNPMFVEDLVRDVAGQLHADSRIGDFVVEAENFESIHNHSAYALIEGRKTGGADGSR